jgi:uridine kinase
MRKPVIIAIAGGTASGKSTLADNLSKKSNPSATAIIRLDHYYRDYPKLTFEERKSLNYDCPEAFDIELVIEHLHMLKEGISIECPNYDFTEHRRKETTQHIKPCPVIILEGIMTLAIPEIRELIDIKIYVDTPADIRLLRRIHRDLNKRGRTLESVAEQYLKTVRPMHDLHVESSKVYADLIVPEGGYNIAALDIIVSHVLQMIEESSR